jgi:sugar lactone lactonase YvrE
MKRPLAVLGTTLIALSLASASAAVGQDPSVSPAVGSEVPDGSPVAGMTIPLPNGWRPEGITADGDTLFVGSLADGAIWRGSASAGTGEVFVQGAEGRVAVGVDFEAGADRLWVAGGGTGEIRAYDATTGEQLGAWQVATAGGTFLNDLVATPGAVYATDSQAAELKVIPLGEGGSLPAADGFTTLPLTGDYTHVEGFNLNGITAIGDQLVAVQSATGVLFRVDPATGEASAIDAGGYSFTNGDGLEPGGPGLFVVRNQLDLVALVTLDEALGGATVLGEVTSPDLDVPSTAAWTGEGLYAVNARFSTEPGPDVAYWITPLDISQPMAPSMPSAAAPGASPEASPA